MDESGIIQIVLPVTAMVFGIGFLAYNISVKARMREMYHRERMAMIEKGMTPPVEMTPPAGPAGETIIKSTIEIIEDTSGAVPGFC